jgi:hypothetical protein
VPATLCGRVIIGDRDKPRKVSDILNAHRDVPRQSLQAEKILAIYSSLVDRVPV